MNFKNVNLLNGKVRVYNYERSPVSFPSETNKNGVFIPGRSEDQEYVMERVAWDDIVLENNRSDLFRVGRLRFHPDEEDEIYEKLGIEDRENIKSDRELAEMLSDDSTENLKKISKIKSLNLITRMKKKLFEMERANKHVPPKVVAVVTEKSEELKNGGKKIENGVISQILEDDRKRKEEEQLKETIKTLMQKVEKLEVDKEKVEKESSTALNDLLKIVEQLKKENEELKNAIAEQQMVVQQQNQEQKNENKQVKKSKSKDD